MATFLTKESLKTLVEATISSISNKGADFYAWRNSPEIDEEYGWTQLKTIEGQNRDVILNEEDVKEIYDAKLNGAYGERFAMSIGTVSALVNNGYNVRIVQFQEEEGVPFDATGWLVIVVETMPVFHVAPWDLDASKIANLVDIVKDNSLPEVSWKGTSKVGEFEALLRGSMESDLNLVEIAIEGSK
jgi:hypothetical protein